ncbi:MAG: hypothetical protein A2900_00880 [Candidatus Chisholmbacteria bacterium RIFCSPLOWO2_01_FULL_50_28]|uniref:Uncharacterized protein n=1 Tax=Candidatus Chisholmbacteria bacterium RIFCSPHIGHO2_01_FULL_52_32 TaxID=1797591 RepID=A0A1G1VUG9_9BACT|nr:MAG: hypothetical protein A2786_05940 [Candidatus Chisholmbacteria bacterium RIFCSPHIGHO2_01_FULL_52_32]OGY19643.1 MAG: hypothetical protein A2900_00880 [Candidatus Chisholmbacteria bacterium RIFCSPLOWO2_01_FULL_50_28]
MGIIGLIGNIGNPLPAYGSYLSATLLLSNIIRIVTIFAGIYAFINIVMAGIGFIGASGNPEAIQRSWQKIYQSLIGLAVVIVSFAIAGLLGLLLYGSADAILRPTITGPGG